MEESSVQPIPYFSIIIPTYNRGSLISKAINSVLEQRFLDWELIIIDDASTDNTQNVLRTFTDSRIQIYKNEKNLERSMSRNLGVLRSKGKYICFLDSDDYYLNNHLEVMHQFICEKKESVALFHSNIEVKDLQKGGETRLLTYNYFSDTNYVEAVFTKHIQPNAVAIHSEIFKKFRFDETMNINEDVYLFAQIASSFPVIHLNKVTVVWIIHNSNTNSLIKDYLSPQIIASKKILNDPYIKPFISKKLKDKKIFELYSSLVYFNSLNRNHLKSFYYFLNGVFLLPTKKKNLTNLQNILYHLPGGYIIKKTIRTLKEKIKL
jgi:glycosyltransferase involved in cell wall biosynthesis